MVSTQLVEMKVCWLYALLFELKVINKDRISNLRKDASEPYPDRKL